ncbi:MAG: hypothetical protein N3D10_02580 [Candidatus Micrarchaeota archaeon]|nr:hypothetical protein [Candidatus Micrarchaeota archaeon]
MYNTSNVNKKTQIVEEDKIRIQKKFEELKKKALAEEDFKEIRKKIYQISNLARKNREEIEPQAFEVLKQIYQKYKEKGEVFLQEKNEEKIVENSWVLKVIAINITSFQNEEVDKILVDMIANRDIDWLVKTSAASGLFLRAIKKGKKENIDFINKIKEPERNKIVYNYLEKYSLMYKIMTNNTFEDSYLYWEEYIQRGQFNSFFVLKYISEEIKELARYYYLSV